MRVTDKLITASELSVVSLDEFKEHLRWPKSDSSEDATMYRKLNAAIEDFKDFSGRPILAETWRMLFDTFDNYEVALSKAPVNVAEIVVSYYDADNEVQVLSSAQYKIIDGGEFGLTKIQFDGTMPTLYDKPQAVYIDYTAGWSTVPSRVIAGILEMASDYFEYRTSDAKRPLVPSAYRAWYPYKVFYSNL